MGIHFDLTRINNEIEELEPLTNETDFWNDQERAQATLKKINDLRMKIDRFKLLEGHISDIQVTIELLEEEEDQELMESLTEKYSIVEKTIEEIHLEILLTGEHDENDVILSIHPGAGGTESQDWAEMLLRMYLRWCDNKGYKVTTLDYQPGEEAGLKSVSLSVEGTNAYGYLKSEKGVHRLVRISPFDASGRRHTSFASIDITPQINDDDQVEINQEDLRIDTFRSSGAGGQHVNTTDSAIRITHIPTGIVVQCQNERSQHKNKETAMRMLMSKLIELKEREHKDKIEDLQGQYGQIAWGNQIRSYVFHPYNMVKDHRTNTETGNVQSVMDGGIDDYINDYLKKMALEKGVI